jgi:peptidoglycan/LPS O-acetylase OafA/YrhL
MAVGIEISIAAAAAPLSAHGADSVDQLDGAALFGFGLAGSLLATMWVQSLSPPPLPRAAVVARWCVIGVSLAVGVLGTRLPPLAQAGLLALGMLGLVVMSVRLAAGTQTEVGSRTAAPRDAAAQTVRSEPAHPS